MNSPKKNRLHDYEAGWLTLLVEMASPLSRHLRFALGTNPRVVEA